MADKRIQDLTPASSVQTNDLFVLEQSGAAKSLTGQILINDLATYLDGHGGISDIVYTPPVAPSLDGTLTITMADETVYSVTVKNGNGITSIVVSYGISNNGTDPTTVQSWGATVTPPTNQYPFGWTRIRLNQTTGVYTDSYSVTVKADDPSITVGTVSAQPGLNASATINNSGTANDPILNFDFELPQGEKGDTGDYIVPVVSYGTSTAAAIEPSTWYNDPSSISYTAGNFIWRKTEFTLHDAQTVQDTKTEIIGYIGQNGSGAGTVTQITMNGTVYTDDGTGNVPMTVDAEDVGAIADPAAKSNGQVLTYDSTADEWVAANPSTGNVTTVNSKGVDSGTTNITIYATDIKMSSSDSTTIPNAMPKPQTSGTPADLGTAARGSALTYSRSDHVHNLPSGLVPSGGSTGQFLVKSSGVDFATQWGNLSDVGALSSEIVNNKNVKVVAGVARYSNGEWGLLNDAGHNPLNAVIASGQTDPGTFTVTHDVGASKVLSLVCGPDEGYAAQGVTCGASVGLDYSVVNVRWPKMAASAIAYNGSTYTHGGVGTISSEDIVQSVSVGSSASLGNYLKINLTKAYPGLFSIFSANQYDWKVLGYGLDYINIQPYLNGTRQSLPLASGAVSLTVAKQTTGVPSTIDHTGCNIWFLGIFEV